MITIATYRPRAEGPLTTGLCTYKAVPYGHIYHAEDCDSASEAAREGASISSIEPREAGALDCMLRSLHAASRCVLPCPWPTATKTFTFNFAQLLIHPLEHASMAVKRRRGATRTKTKLLYGFHSGHDLCSSASCHSCPRAPPPVSSSFQTPVSRSREGSPQEGFRCPRTTIPGRRYTVRAVHPQDRDVHTCIAEPEVSGKHHARP